MTHCPICECPAPRPFLTRAGVSVHQNLIADTREAARALRGGTLSLHACDACGFVFNSAFDPSLLHYGAAYDNTQTCSPAFERHIEALADHVVRARGIRNAQIVEIGCGKGAFLRALAHRDPANRGIGFDPSYVGPDTAVDGRVRFERRFYDETCTGFDPDAIVCRHVIEHVQHPVALLRTIRQTLRKADAQIFFETPCVEWILRNETVWDFFYEHCSYFTADSLAVAFERGGFDALSVTHVFGGQYLWAEGRPSTSAGRPARDAGRIVDLARQYAARESVVLAELRDRVVELSRRGPVAIWGAAAKGVTLASLIDPDGTLLACMVDINPNKRGKYLPGSGHPIVGPADIPARGIRTALVTNPNYFDENARMVREAGLNVELVDLMRPPASEGRREAAAGGPERRKKNEAHADPD